MKERADVWFLHFLACICLALVCSLIIWRAMAGGIVTTLCLEISPTRDKKREGETSWWKEEKEEEISGRWSVVNLSFSFRTPSTSSYLLPGLMVRYGERRQKTTNHDNENSSLISLLEFSLSWLAVQGSCRYLPHPSFPTLYRPLGPLFNPPNNIRQPLFSRLAYCLLGRVEGPIFLPIFPLPCQQTNQNIALPFDSFVGKRKYGEK